MESLSSRPKELVLIAGPNGAGKTTLANAYVGSRFPNWPQVNADATLASIQAVGPLAGVPAQARAAAELVDRAALCLCLLSEPVIIETVLSSRKYVDLVLIARRRGLIFRLVYIATESADLNVSRVHQRVLSGGHDVPEDKIRKRWTRSLENLVWFATHADRLVLADNSATEPRVLALRHLGGPLEVLEPSHPACRRLTGWAGSLTADGSS